MPEKRCLDRTLLTVHTQIELRLLEGLNGSALRLGLGLDHLVLVLILLILKLLRRIDNLNDERAAWTASNIFALLQRLYYCVIPTIAAATIKKIVVLQGTYLECNLKPIAARAGKEVGLHLGIEFHILNLHLFIICHFVLVLCEPHRDGQPIE